MYKWGFLAAFCLWFFVVAQNLSADENDPAPIPDGGNPVEAVSPSAADLEKQKADQDAKEWKDKMDHATADPAYYNGLAPADQVKLREMASKPPQDSSSN